jgi:hypothetical protein
MMQHERLTTGGTVRRSLLAVLSFLLFACAQPPARPPVVPNMSVEQAKKITADIPSTGLAPPPRTIVDITAILDEQKPDESYRAALLARLSQPPTSTDPAALSAYYRVRAQRASALDMIEAASLGTSRRCTKNHR